MPTDGWEPNMTEPKHSGTKKNTAAVKNKRKDFKCQIWNKMYSKYKSMT